LIEGCGIKVYFALHPTILKRSLRLKEILFSPFFYTFESKN